MKKKLVILLAAVMVLSCFALASCGGSSSDESTTDLSDSKYVGTWKAQGLSIGDDSEDFDEEYLLTINGDGTGILSGGDDEDASFTWKPTDGGFKASGDVNTEFKEDGDDLVTKILGAELRFVRYDGSSTEKSETETSAETEYGYTGSDPVEAAVYKYVAEELSKNYELPDGSVSIPVIQFVDIDVDNDDGDAEVLGDFWVYNYVVDGDTLKCVSGGAHPGKIDLVKSGDSYTVEEFEGVQDGSNYEASAKDIFEEHYDEFAKINSDSDAREKVRAETIAAYVKANGLDVTKYQDEGWDPVDIPL